MKYYTGIGARETPPEILNIMTAVAQKLQSLGYILRSGGARGADTAFEEGAGDKVNIYLPFHGFRHKERPRKASDFTYTQEAMDLAKKYHPAWSRCSYEAQKYHARNSHQVLGRDLKTPSEFIICWTKDGDMVGGTSQALRIATDYHIPIYNLAIEDDLRKLGEFILNTK
jgi:hypothetical protein